MCALSHWLLAALVGSTVVSQALAAGPLPPNGRAAKPEVVKIKWQTDLQKAAEVATAAAAGHRHRHDG